MLIGHGFGGRSLCQIPWTTSKDQQLEWVTIPHWVFWAQPEPLVINVEDDRVLWQMYQEVLGSAVVLEDLVTVVNKDHLIRLWPGMIWDRVVRQAWEDRFPELRGRSGFND